jgi:hypothetical protein
MTENGGLWMMAWHPPAEPPPGQPFGANAFLVIFGSPAAGTPVMAASPLAANLAGLNPFTDALVAPQAASRHPASSGPPSARSARRCPAGRARPAARA